MLDEKAVDPRVAPLNSLFEPARVRLRSRLLFDRSNRMNISQLIQKLEAILETEGDREVITVRDVDGGYKMSEPELCAHYTAGEDQKDFRISIL